MTYFRSKSLALLLTLVAVLGGTVLASCDEQNHGYHYPAGE